jgi:DNA-binding response OmpR family regulator
LNAHEAYDLMYNALYDLIISDVMMPGIDGFEFAETVRTINKIIPILFMTARDDIASKQKGFQAGIDDYMVKPVNMDELILQGNRLRNPAAVSRPTWSKPGPSLAASPVVCRALRALLVWRCAGRRLPSHRFSR